MATGVKHLPAALDINPALFAALGDGTRLVLLVRLGTGGCMSITRLSKGLTVTRQAVSKHLQVLKRAGLVKDHREGRECLFELDPEPLTRAARALEDISRQWDESLARLKSFVEE